MFFCSSLVRIKNFPGCLCDRFLRTGFFRTTFESSASPNQNFDITHVTSNVALHSRMPILRTFLAKKTPHRNR